MTTRPTYILGDTHSVYPTLFKILENIRIQAPNAVIIHVGDINLDEIKHTDQPWPQDFFYIHGNHDQYNFVKNDPAFLGRFGVRENLFFISGGHTPEQFRGVVGAYLKVGNRMTPPYWPDEELTRDEADQAFDLYRQNPPDIVVSHDCPTTAKDELFPRLHPRVTSYTNVVLEAMFQFHQPLFWFFGHYHAHRDQIVQGTRFICLNEFQYKKVPKTIVQDEDEDSIGNQL